MQKRTSHGALSVWIIANNKYRHWESLSCCHNDGDLLHQTIADFHPDVPVQVLKDADHHVMLPAIHGFLASDGLWGCWFQKLMFFAGHGVETGQGTFMLPTDVPPKGANESMDLTRCVSVELLKLQFRGQSSKGTLGIVLACCRHAVQAAPVRLPSNLRYQMPKSAVVVLHGCEPADEIDDGSESAFTLAGDALPTSNLGLRVPEPLSSSGINFIKRVSTWQLCCTRQRALLAP